MKLRKNKYLKPVYLTWRYIINASMLEIWAPPPPPYFIITSRGRIDGENACVLLAISLIPTICMRLPQSDVYVSCYLPMQWNIDYVDFSINIHVQCLYLNSLDNMVKGLLYLPEYVCVCVCNSCESGTHTSSFNPVRNREELAHTGSDETPFPFVQRKRVAKNALYFVISGVVPRTWSLYAACDHCFDNIAVVSSCLCGISR